MRPILAAVVAALCLNTGCSSKPAPELLAPDGSELVRARIEMKSWRGNPEGGKPMWIYSVRAENGRLSVRRESARYGTNEGDVPREEYLEFFAGLLQAGVLDSETLDVDGWDENGDAYYHRIDVLAGERRNVFDAQQRRMLGLFVDQTADARISISNRIADFVGRHATRVVTPPPARASR